MDCTWITAYRTGAATALAAKHLAGQRREVVGILACGVQGRTNLMALAVLFPIAMNLGLALDDMAVAPEVCRRAKERGIGTWLVL